VPARPGRAAGDGSAPAVGRPSRLGSRVAPAGPERGRWHPDGL